MAYRTPRARREVLEFPSSCMKVLESPDPAFVRLEWALSSDSIDRDGDNFRPKGLTLAPHVNVVDTHGMGNPGIRSILGVVEQGSLRAETRDGVELAIAVLKIGGSNPDAQIARGMIDDGFLGNGSIRFDPFYYVETVEDMEGVKTEREVRRKRGDPRRYAFGPRDIREAEVLEFSLLAVPSNADARERMAKAYGVELRETPPLALELVEASTPAAPSDGWDGFFKRDAPADPWGGFFDKGK